MTLNITIPAGHHEFRAQVSVTLESAAPEKGYYVVDHEIVGVSRYQLIGDAWRFNDKDSSAAMVSLLCELNEQSDSFRQRLIDQVAAAWEAA